MIKEVKFIFYIIRKYNLFWKLTKDLILHGSVGGCGGQKTGFPYQS